MEEDELVGKKGYKTIGFYSGLVGTIQLLSDEDSEKKFVHPDVRYKIIFPDGSNIVARKKHIKLYEEGMN